MAYPIIPFPIQWNGKFDTEAQLLISQYQEGVRHGAHRNRINHTLDTASVTVFLANFTQLATMESFLQTPPGVLFQLSETDTRGWRCMKYNKSLEGTKGEYILTLDLVQVHKP